MQIRELWVNVRVKSICGDWWPDLTRYFVEMVQVQLNVHYIGGPTSVVNGYDSWRSV